ncbi:MAG: CaiB/BaiF CoA-transferase family protein [Chloroflexota bacterium]|nr:CaiB/BaiF CoA-transferase family protein [Chloroflexota bacterium]
MTNDQPRQLPLDGVRVLSQAIVWAGPFGSMILADLGAEVIEIESIRHMSPTRGSYRQMPPELMDGPTGAIYLNRDGSEGFWDRNSGFNFAKRGHQSVTVDLGSDDGRELFYGLIRDADVFIENNAADVVDNLGISWERLSAINPRLIMVRFPGFGISGPYEHFKGFGATMESVVGHTMLRGYRDSDPSQTPAIYHGDPNAGAHVATAVQIALIARERTGEGQLIEMSQAEAVVHHTAYDLIDYQMNGRSNAHWGNRHPSMAPYGVFRCAGDDRWLALAVPSDEAFARLCDVMGQPELATDERFADAAARYGHQDDLEPIVEAWTLQHGDDELMHRLQAAGVPAAVVAHQTEMFDDPHLLERGFFIEVDHPEAGVRRHPAPMARFERMPLTPVRGPAPTLGQHNEDVLMGILGISRERFEELERDQVIGTVYTEDADR